MVFAGSERVASGVGLSKEDCLEKVQAALTGKCNKPAQGGAATIAQFRPYDSGPDFDIPGCYCQWGQDVRTDVENSDGREICLLSSVYTKEQATKASEITVTDICQVVLTVCIPRCVRGNQQSIVSACLAATGLILMLIGK